MARTDVSLSRIHAELFEMAEIPQNMKKRIAQVTCILTIGVVISLSSLVASAQGSPPAKNTPLAPNMGTLDEGAVFYAASEAGIQAKGRSVYAAQKCSSCHSIAGEGNSRYPLDSVGLRLKREDMLPWITGTGEAAKTIPPGMVRRKQRYRTLPQDDLDALVSYLSTLKASK